MNKKNILEFDNINLFNYDLLHQYDPDGQKGFLGYLMRYKQWNIEENKIIFPEIRQKEQIETILREYDNAVKKEYLRNEKTTLEKASALGIEKCMQLIKEETEQIENKTIDSKKKNDKIL